MAEITLEQLAKRVEDVEQKLQHHELGHSTDWRVFAGRRDPSDPDEREFLEILDQQRRADLEQTLRELEKECSNSSSTPTT